MEIHHQSSHLHNPVPGFWWAMTTSAINRLLNLSFAKHRQCFNMRGMRKQIGELDVVDGPAVLAKEPGVAREGFGIAGDVVNRLQCFKTLEKSLMFF